MRESFVIFFSNAIQPSIMRYEFNLFDCHSRLIAKGASGGRGALLNQMTSHGSIVKTTMLLHKGERIHILVGQEGISASACEQVNAISSHIYLIY